MSKTNKIAFRFAIDSGPSTGLGCGSWRVWTSKNREDTYIADRGLGGTWKISLHGDVAWRYAVTSEHMRDAEKPVLPTDHDRAPWKFTPPSFTDGRRLSFFIAVTRGAMLPETPDPAAAPILVEDRWDRMSIAEVWMTEPGAGLTDSHTVVGGPLPLPSGRQVWVTRRIVPVHGEPETGIVSAMVEPITHDIAGVSTPGVIIRAVRLG
ncbi:hypothetical protein [Micromonospora tulbaghiae]|uniref:hypothetical protein n=1 Tax=Micromonospora tulbaghiae TaxID=479978 RepID=UPI001112EB8B|nr:hypothetical protein [Micromonospora tulbaghiae]